jgi:hypothetical protein
MLFTNSVHASLQDNGNGLIYDTDLNITWLADANSGGAKTWDDAVSWATGLTVGNAINWRLPTANTCTSSSCTGEFNHLFYDELGGTTSTPLTGNVGLFSNIQGVYWTGEQRDTSSAYVFYFGNGDLAGTRDWAFKSGTVSVWAVHDGNISAVPLPATVWLFASGMVGLFGLARRRRVTA